MAFEPQRAKTSPEGLKLKISEPGRLDDQMNIIDTLVSALERMVAERHEPSAEAVQQSYAALALARGEG